MKREPVMVAIYALVVAGRGLLVAFGVELDATQEAAIDAFILAALGLAWAVRARVTPANRDTPRLRL